MRISSCSSGTNGCARGGILRALNRPRKAQPAGSTPSDGHHRAVVGFGEVFYIGKVDTFDRGRFVPLPVKRYGHCAFTTAEVLAAFGAMVNQP
jgi:hypothetical protein